LKSETSERFWLNAILKKITEFFAFSVEVDEESCTKLKGILRGRRMASAGVYFPNNRLLSSLIFPKISDVRPFKRNFFKKTF
jgi:hypothetical protein